MSPFKALYGRDPPNLFDTYSKPSHNPTVSDILLEREELLHSLKRRIARSQENMAEFANRHRRDVQFDIGDKVLLRLQPYRQHSVAKPLSAKLGRRYYGPFTITERIGKVAYRLQLPVDSRIHDVFHVSLLRKFIPSLSPDSETAWPNSFQRGKPVDTPVRAAASRTVLVDGIPQEQWQVYWSSDCSSAPTWEPTAELSKHFPHLHLEDKAAVMEGGVDRASEVRSPLSHTTATPIVEKTGSHVKETTQLDKEAVATEEEEQPREKTVKEPKPSGSGRPKRVTRRPAKYKDYSTR